MQNFLHDLAMVFKKPPIIFSMVLQDFQDKISSLGRAERFQWFSLNILWSWIWYPGSHYIMISDVKSRIPYMIMDMVSKIQQKCQTLQTNEGLSIH